MPTDMQGLDREKMLKAFFNEQFIITADGKILKGKILKQEMMPRVYRASLYTGVVDTTASISPYVLFTEIEYPIDREPQIITISPPIEDGFKSTLANIGFIVYHKNIPVNDLRYLGTTETLRLDWTDPWYTKFDNINLKRHHSSSLLSFLYIDPLDPGPPTDFPVFLDLLLEPFQNRDPPLSRVSQVGAQLEGLLEAPQRLPRGYSLRGGTVCRFIGKDLQVLLQAPPYVVADEPPLQAFLLQVLQRFSFQASEKSQGENPIPCRE